MPYLTYFVEILGSMAAIGVVSGIVETIMLLTVANLVDQRYTSDYGNAFAITEIGSAITLLVGNVSKLLYHRTEYSADRHSDVFEFKQDESFSKNLETVFSVR